MDPLRIVFFDLEIAKDVKEVGGWQAVRDGEAGISSIVLFDSETGRYHVYGPTVKAGKDGKFYISDLGTLPNAVQHLNSADVIVGFNSQYFDVPVIEACLGLDVVTPYHHDLLEVVWRALGDARRKGYRLNDICKRTLGMEKTDTGATAPKLFKSGDFAKLIDYNINDVAMTLALFNFIEEHGYIIDINGEPLYVTRLGGDDGSEDS